MRIFSVEPIGVIRSEIRNREDAPLFYTEGAPNAFLEILPAYMEGLRRMQAGRRNHCHHLAPSRSQGRAKGSSEGRSV